jgi:hypothetical protein
MDRRSLPVLAALLGMLPRQSIIPPPQPATIWIIMDNMKYATAIGTRFAAEEGERAGREIIPPGLLTD